MDLDAVEEKQPGRCDQDVYKDGDMVFMTHTIRSWFVEAWVKKVRETSGQKVDWHYSGGRACILTNGDFQKVHEAIQKQLPLLRQMWRWHIEKGTHRNMWPDDRSELQIALIYYNKEQIQGNSVMLGPQEISPR